MRPDRDRMGGCETNSVETSLLQDDAPVLAGLTVIRPRALQRASARSGPSTVTPPAGRRESSTRSYVQLLSLLTPALLMGGDPGGVVYLQVASNMSGLLAG